MKPHPALLLAIIALVLAALGGLLLLATRQANQGGNLEASVDAFLQTPLPPAWREEQLSSENVQLALQEKTPVWQERFTAKGLTWPPRQVLFQAFWDEAVVEAWVARGPAQPYLLIQTFPMCPTVDTSAPAFAAAPATLEGMPKAPPAAGFYTLRSFYRKDFNYFLSVGLDWPNAVDQTLLRKGTRITEVVLRGGCRFEGSLPLGNEGIKELYILAMEARAAGQKQIPFYLFPARLTDEALARLQKEARGDARKLALLSSLKLGFDAFEGRHRPIPVTATPQGQYRFDTPP